MQKNMNSQFARDGAEAFDKILNDDDSRFNSYRYKYAYNGWAYSSK